MVRQDIYPARAGAQIQPEVYGNFSEHLGRCIYEGLYVGEDSAIPNVNGMRTDVVEALRNIQLPVLRWPGGCFADEYHWKEGIGPKADRKRIVNTNWGYVVEDNSFGTHEFLELCRQVGCKPYINGNVGSGTVQEMAEWIEYMTAGGDSTMAKLRGKNGHAEPWQIDYFGVGNENWGCGGNMRPEYYADLYRRYQSYVKQYGEKKIFKIACGPGTNVSDPNYNWTEVLMKNAGAYMDGLSLHYYTTPFDDWNHKGSATDFTREEYEVTLRKALFMETLLAGHGAVMDKYDPEKRVALVVDEWGTWYDVEPGTNPGFLYQQNTMRDALVAAVNLNIFNNHCDTVCMANIAQVVNVLQAMVLTEGDKMITTPTYHVFEMYKGHQNARQLESYAETSLLEQEDLAVPELHVSASQQADGSILVTAANLNDAREVPLHCLLSGVKAAGVEGRVLTGRPDAFNSFDAPAQVCPQPLDAAVTDDGFTATLPPCSVAAFTVRPC